MNDCLITYIEKYIFKTIECVEIMQRFQYKKSSRTIELIKQDVKK